MTERLVKSLGVVGAGQMGTGIAQVAAQQGLSVHLVDVSPQRAEGAKRSVAVGLGRLLDRGRLDREDYEAVLARIRPGTSLAVLGDVDFVIEAATESQALKQDLFRSIDAAARPDAILASNTSSISITLLGAATSRPERVIGLHFMNPVPQMRLVEIVRGLATDDATYDDTVQLAVRFGKMPVGCRDIPGFIVNRILLPLINEAIYALYEGLGGVSDIDEAARQGLNHPMGPLELADLIGLDTCLAILEVMHRELGEDKYRPCPLLRQYVAANWLGRKTAKGFYVY